MNLKIRTVLPLIISALAIMAVVSAGFAAYDAYGRRQEAEAFLKINQISQRLLQSAGQWAVERGMTNAPLKSPDALPAERRAEIVKIRTVADQAFREAAQQLRAVPAMKAAEKDIVEAEGAFRAFEAFRGKVDDNLAKPGSGRTSEVVEGFAPAITSLIEVAANKLRLTLETLTSPPTVELTQLVGLRHLTAQMAENAGRERAFFGGIVGARSKLTMEEEFESLHVPEARSNSPGKRSGRAASAAASLRRSSMRSPASTRNTSAPTARSGMPFSRRAKPENTRSPAATMWRAPRPRSIRSSSLPIR